MARQPPAAVFDEPQFNAEWVAFVDAFVHRRYRARLLGGPAKGLQRLHHDLGVIIDLRRAVVPPPSASFGEVERLLKLAHAPSSGYLFDANTPEHSGPRSVTEAVFRVESYGSAAVSCGLGACGYAKDEGLHPLRLILVRDPKNLATVRDMVAQLNQANRT